MADENKFWFSVENRAFTYAAIALNLIFPIWAVTLTAGFVFLALLR